MLIGPVQDWLQQRGRSEADVASIRDGYRGALGKHTLAVISFRDFARTFSWFASTLQMMAEHDDDPNKPPGEMVYILIICGVEGVARSGSMKHCMWHVASCLSSHNFMHATSHLVQPNSPLVRVEHKYL